MWHVLLRRAALVSELPVKYKRRADVAFDYSLITNHYALLSTAGVVQWQNGSFPSCTRGFDSPHPLPPRFQRREKRSGSVDRSLVKADGNVGKLRRARQPFDVLRCWNAFEAPGDHVLPPCSLGGLRAGSITI